MKFISKFGSKNGAGVYNALKEDARKIYKKPQLDNPQKGDIKRIAALNSAKSQTATKGDEQKNDEREKSQTESNLSGEILHAQSVSGKEQNLKNRSQVDQNLESLKLQSLESESGAATIEEVKVAESNLSDDLGSAEQLKGVEQNLSDKASSEDLKSEGKGQNLSNKRPPQKSNQVPAPQNEAKNKAENAVKTQLSIKIDEVKKQEIRKIAFESKNLGDFHNGLVKKYGAEDAGKLYKALKQKAKEYLNKRNAAK